MWGRNETRRTSELLCRFYSTPKFIREVLVLVDDVKDVHSDFQNFRMEVLFFGLSAQVCTQVHECV